MPSGPVFECEKSVFFVMDEDDSTSDAGGCTQAWWDGQCPNGTEAEAAAAMAKLFDDVSSGAPLMEAYNCAYDESENEIILPGAAAGGVEVGMVAHIRESVTPDENIETGRYRITYVGSGYIQCADIDDDGTNTVVDVVIGGAFYDLQDALDETDATDHSVTIHVQSNDIVEAAIDVDVGGGNNTKNTFKRIVGFNTSPGDMDYGGTYYESPNDILKNGSISSSKTVLLDGDGIGGYSILNIDQDNIIFENFHLTNTDGENAILFTGTPQNIVFRNCRFSDVLSAFNSAADNLLVDSSYTHDDLSNHSYVTTGFNTTFLNCVGNVGAGKTYINIAGDYGSVIGCVTIGSQFNVQFINNGNSGLVMNNTFYDTTIYGVRNNGGEGVVVVNNIFALTPGAIGLYATTAGSFIYNDYNCFIESDGTPLTVGGNGSGYEVPVKGKHSVEVDPDFVDAVNGDFRVRNPLLLRGGRPGPDGRAAVIGAIGQEYRFAERGRMMNPGRMTIVR